MYLKAINLKGFKSFPDRTRLTFSPGVSVIVGPNGCGKSNITDAVLWALGEQSPNAVRGNSMRDVIFAGGQGQSPRRFAEVEVVIDNSEGRAASEFSEISITRRIERDGDGEYRLNGARCRLADVLEVLSDTNMGREMHSVISQGRVEQIVNSKPRDRRLLIEEAAGLGKHRKRRHRAQLKMERARDNLDRALDVEREARSRLRPLKRQAEAAERTAKLVAQEDELRSVLVAGELREQQDLLATGEGSLIEIRKRRDSVEERLDEVRVRRAAIEEKVASGEDERRALGQRIADARGGRRARPRPRRVDRVSRARAPRRPRRAPASPDRARRRAGHGGRPRWRGSPSSRRLWRASTRARAAPTPSCRPFVRRPAPPSRPAPSSTDSLPAVAEAAEQAASSFQRASQARDLARADSEKAAQRRAALQGELAAVEAKLARAAMEGSDEVLAGMIETGPGIERALSAALGERLRAAVVDTIGDGVGRLQGSDGASRALVSGTSGDGAAPSPPVDGARRLLDLVKADGAAGEIAERLLADAWIVDELESTARRLHRHRRHRRRRRLRRGRGRAAPAAARGNRPRARRPLGARGAGLAPRPARADRRASRPRPRARRGVARHGRRASATRPTSRCETRAAPSTKRPRRRRRTRVARRAGAPSASEDGPTTVKRAQLEAELAAERRHAEAAERAGEARRRDQERLRRRIELETETLPALGSVREALANGRRAARAPRRDARRCPGRGWSRRGRGRAAGVLRSRSTGCRPRCARSARR